MRSPSDLTVTHRQVEAALQDTQQLQEELDRVQHKIRESERNVGASLESLQVVAGWHAPRHSDQLDHVVARLRILAGNMSMQLTRSPVHGDACPRVLLQKLHLLLDVMHVDPNISALSWHAGSYLLLLAATGWGSG
jgi:hypothetical protein